MRANWIWLGLVLAVPLVGLQVIFGVRTTAAEQGIPLLMVLLINEFGFVACIISVGFAIKLIRQSGIQLRPLFAGVLSVLIAIGFLIRLLQIYPAS